MGIELKGLQRERVRRGLTQKELSQLSGITASYVCELESGKKRAGGEAVRRLSAVLAAHPVTVDLVSADAE